MRSPLLKSLCGILCFVIVSASAQNTDTLKYGTWQTYGDSIISSTIPQVHGRLLDYNWKDIETSNNVWNWTGFDKFLKKNANGLPIMLMVFTKENSPGWLYTSAGVPKVIERNSNGDSVGFAPYFPDSLYKFYFKRMIDSVANHIAAYPSSLRNYIVGIQNCMGEEGDYIGYRGEDRAGEDPVIPPQYQLTTQQFTDLFKEFTLYYKDAYASSNPKITLIINPGSFRQDNVNWSLVNCPNSWYKFTTLGKIYQQNNELDNSTWLLPVLNAKQSGAFIRGMTELSADNLSQGIWSTHTPRNFFALFSYMIYWGMDISDQIPTSIQNSLYVPAYDFYNKYAGKKDTANSFVAMCALHDGLDASDGKRFPKQIYGSLSKGNVQRYINIQNQFAVYGARLDDTAAATKRPTENMDATGINDVGWSIFSGNYGRSLYQINANTTSEGYWNVDAPNDVNSIYGRFARGFDLANGKNALYFDADNIFLNAPVNSRYPVIITITYLDNDTGSWQLYYDGQNNTDQPSLAVTCTNSGVWRKASVTLKDAYFANRGINASDFYIKSTNNKNVIFALVELERPDTTAPNVGFIGPSKISFDTLCVNSISAVKSFPLSGSFLDNSNVIIGPLAGFSFATAADGDYRDSLIITNYGASFNQIIYVKFKPTSASSYNGSLVIYGGGVNTIHINMIGTGVNSNPQQAPAQPTGILSALADSMGICGSGNFNFSIAPVVAATSYNWTPPLGCNISSISADGASISLTTTQGFSSGTLAVTANNGCGSSLPATKVLSAVPATPGNISGPSKIKANQSGLIYSVTAVAGLNYTWIVPAGAAIISGQNTSTITVNWGNVSGKIKVIASNSCGSSTQTTLGVNFVTTPTLYPLTTLSSFGSICVNGSAIKSFSLFGTLLDGSDIVISPLSGYTFSLSTNGTYSSSLKITGYGTTLNQAIYVKFNPTSVTTYNGNISVVGGGVSTFNIAASGSGVSSSPYLFSAITNITCSGLQNGAVNLIPTNGTGPFSYAWAKDGSFISSAEDISGLSPGNYKVIATSLGACTTSTSVVLNDPAPLTIVATKNDITCNGNTTSLIANATGGSLPYSFSINNSAFQNNGTFNNLSAGDYTVTVKDANGCTQTTNATINEPSAIGVNTLADDVLCNGSTTTLTITATGGAGNYQYQVDSGSYQTGNTFTVNAGTHTIAVKDANGCTQTTTTIINEPSAINVSAFANDITSNGGTTTLTISATGGAGSYQYKINDGIFQTDNTFIVGAGTYTITVKDGNECTQTTTTTINEPSTISVNTSSNDITCNGGTTTLTVTATGGAGSYQYQLDDGTFQTDNTFTVSAGTHNVVVKDANESTQTTTATINEPSVITINPSANDITCNGGTTTLSVSATGGTGNYQYQINDGGFQTDNTFTVNAGTYTITVKDGNGCTQTTTATINESSAITVNASANDILCNGGTTILTVTANGGAGSYQYQLDDGTYQSSDTFTVGAGSYTINVKDANGCTGTTSATLTQPSVITVSTSQGTINCYGSTTTITVTANGGAGNYQYQLDNGLYQSSNTFTVSAGSYTLNVKDANGCTGTTSATLTQPSAITVSTSQGTIICYESTTTITVTADGGAGNYQYQLDNGLYQSSNTFTVSAGSYTINVKDANGCTGTTSATLTQPSAISVSALPGAINCYGSTTTLTVTASGGAENYQYQLDNGLYQSSNTFTVGAGIHTVIAKDAKGCTGTTTITINQPSAISVNPSAGVITCNGGTTTLTVTASGGAGGYQYKLDVGSYKTTNTFTVSAGTHTITVKDSKGCTGTTTSNIAQPSAITVKASAGTITCNGGTTTLTATATGGTGSYQYKLDANAYQSSNTFIVKAGKHTVTVKDANNCTGSTSISIANGKGSCFAIAQNLSIEKKIPFFLNGIVSPNPSETAFTLLLKGNRTEPVEIKVLDIYGRTVYHTKGALNDKYKFGDQFTAGVYIVKIFQGNSVATIKIIKE